MDPDELLDTAVAVLEERLRRAGIPRGTVRRTTLESIAGQPACVYRRLVDDMIAVWRRHRFAVRDGPLAWNWGGGLARVSDEEDGQAALVQILGSRPST